MNSVALTILLIASTNLVLGYGVAVCLGWHPAVRRRALWEARQRHWDEEAAAVEVTSVAVSAVETEPVEAALPLAATDVINS